MLTDTQFNSLLAELIGIRHALEARTANKPIATSPTTTATRTPDSLPMPDVIIDCAGDVTIHFGKNAGTPVRALNDKQLLWYGADREPQLKRDGTPFPPRELDTLLKNACRTFWHQRTGAIPVAAPAPAPTTQSNPAGDEDVPF